jgi:SAM-dependent methyltransferase
MNDDDSAARWKVIQTWLPEGGIGAELGVFKGHFSKYLLRKNPQRLYLVDPWYRYSPYWSWVQGQSNSAVHAVRKVLEDYDAEIHAGQIVPVIDFSVQFLKTLPNEHLDFCYLDSSHSYEGTVSELAELRRTIKSNGILLGDDWRDDPNHKHYGVRRAVEEYIGRGEAILLFQPEVRQWGIKFVK